ncbi:acetylxylan esterase [Pseudonocardia sp.]|jgi:hypothetical protein|uniref:poly(ethylene terephthalate) hydrolase family protein n=1 Tax=Pseudonocardia sp. TaxID=60912 RepID=UPI002F4216E7
MRLARRRLGAILIGTLVGLATFQAPAFAASFHPVPAAPAGGTIESKYAANGPNAVSTQRITDPASGGAFALYYPSNMGSAKLPIITWGNGTGGTPQTYDPLLRHIASWGYAVVASYSPNTGSGREILAGAKYMVAQNSAEGSPFNGKLDTANIGATGHSQGASGVVAANKASGGLIKATVPIGLPGFTTGTGVTGSIFYIGGTADTICPPQGQLNAYAQTTVPAAVGSLVGATHFTEPIVTGGGGYQVAWMEWKLKGDSAAGAAFTGATPELTHNPRWAQQATKNLGAASAS